MGNTISSVSLTLFEIVNELFVAISSGVLGITILIHHGLCTCHIVRTFLVATVTVTSLVYVCRMHERAEPAKTKVVVITGCDSGLGYSLAQHACERGFTVFAGFMNEESKGAVELKRICEGKMHSFQVDVTDAERVKMAVGTVERFLRDNSKYVLWAIVNNAGVMVFGEFEWLTERLIKQQLNVNLYGTMLFTKAFCPLLRNYQGRIITVTSHCALQTLPGISVYGATKAGLQAFSDGLRVELGKYGVKVTTLIPGSFANQSNIMSKQVDNVYEMFSSFNSEQRTFYEDYFKRYNSYLALLSGPSQPKKLEDRKLYEVFEGALLDEKPQRIYLCESWTYTFYHTLFKIVPFRIRDYLVCRFMKMPEFQAETKISANSIS